MVPIEAFLARARPLIGGISSDLGSGRHRSQSTDEPVAHEASSLTLGKFKLSISLVSSLVRRTYPSRRGAPKWTETL